MTDAFDPTQITPPPELVPSWSIAYNQYLMDDAVLKAYRAGAAEGYAAGRQDGADEELGACFAWLRDKDDPISARCVRLHRFRVERRPPAPKPPTLREEALKALAAADDRCYVKSEDVALIRRAFESIPEETP